VKKRSQEIINLIENSGRSDWVIDCANNKESGLTHFRDSVRQSFVWGIVSNNIRGVGWAEVRDYFKNNFKTNFKGISQVSKSEIN
jgi:hypothetical protein